MAKKKEAKSGQIGSSGLFGRTREGLLSVLYERPDMSFSLRALVRRVGTGMGAVQRELAHLVENGVVIREGAGRASGYRANERSPIFKELRSLLLKTAGIVPALRKALENLSNRIEAAFIFGSAARGELDALSDLDVMVIGECSFDETVQALAEAQETLLREINPAVYGPDEWRSKLRAGHPFVTAVARGPKIFLWGDEDDLERLGKRRVAEAPGTEG